MTPAAAAALLGVDIQATAPEVEHAFRVRARQVHPDSGGADDAFIRLTEARDILLQPQEPMPFVVGTRPVRRRSWPLFWTWVGLLALAIALSAIMAPQPFTIAEPLVRYPLLVVGLLGYALTGRTGFGVLAVIAIAATALVALLFTTLGALVGLLIMVAAIYGLALIGRTAPMLVRAVDNPGR